MKSQVRILFFVMLLLRLVIAIFMWPGADEAYYYVYTLHPALSYFDHPPLVALAGGLIPSLFNWLTPLSLRLGTIILFSFAVYIFFLLAKKYLNEKESLIATAIFIVVPMFFISGTVLLPDAPLIFFWVLGLYCFKKTIDEPKIKNWILLGAIIGLGMLSKYTAGFLYIGGFIFLLSDIRRRKLFLTPGPYISILVSIIVFLPVIIFNIQNDFISFSFQAGRVGIGEIKFRYFYQSLLGQMGYLLPFFFFPAVYYVIKSIKWKSELYKFTFCFGAVPIGFFVIASLFRRVLPHWPVIGYITLTLVVGKYYYGLFEKKRKLFNIHFFSHIIIVVGLIFVILIQIHTGILMNNELPSSGIQAREKIRDLTIDIIGWDKFADYITENFKDDEIFLFTHKWYLGGQIAFAVKGNYPVLCLSSPGEARGFNLWQKQKEQIGRDGLFISTSKFYLNPTERYAGYFDRIELIKKIPIIRASKLVKIIYVFKCENFKKMYLSK